MCRKNSDSDSQEHTAVPPPAWSSSDWMAGICVPREVLQVHALSVPTKDRLSVNPAGEAGGAGHPLAYSRCRASLKFQSSLVEQESSSSPRGSLEWPGTQERPSWATRTI